MSKTTGIIALLIALAGGLAIGRLTSAGGEDDELEEGVVAADEDVERFKVPVTDAQPVRGPKDAPVTIVEFSDFECPFCSRVEPTLSRIVKEYGSRVRVVWRNNPLPFHQNAGPAAQLANEAFAQGGSQKFWKIHGILFANQKALSRSDLEKYGSQAGLDAGKVKAALDANKHQASIAADMALATDLDARGTPAFFINGRKLMGAQPYEEFKKLIDEELKTAEKLEEKGVKRSAIYATLMKEAKDKADPPQEEPQARKEPDPNAVYKVPTGNAPQKGPSDALVTIVQFSDFECPFCSRVEPTINEVMKKYGKDVRVLWKNNPLPFHNNAMPAAEAASEAFAQKGAAGFWKMHELMFKNQQALGKDKLVEYAKELGLNLAKFNKALDEHTHKSAIEADMKLAADLGASGTPSFFINGRNLRGAQPLPAFTAVIDEELKKAKEKIKSGTPKAKLYETIIASGATSPQTIAPAAKEVAQEPDANKIYALPVPAKAPAKGPKGAKVVIQEFSDFQCPFCARAVPLLDQVIKEYGNKVRVIWRNFPLPFHESATPAAEAAMEVFAQKGDAGFWKMYETLFANQQALSRADLEKYASQIGGVNMDRFKKAMDDHIHKAGIQADMDAVTKAGAQIGTPSFFINGKLVQGAVPFEVLKKEIDAALAAK